MDSILDAIRNWGVWDYPALWAPLLCSIFAMVRELCRIAFDKRLRQFGHITQLQRVYDCCNTVAAGPNVNRAAVLVCRNGRFLSHRTKAHVTVLAESSSVGTIRGDWQDHPVGKEYLDDLVAVVKDKKHWCGAKDTEPALRGTWHNEGTIGSWMYLVKVERTPIWKWLFGGYEIVALYYLSVNLRAEATDEDWAAIEPVIERLRRLYKNDGILFRS